MTEDFKVLIVDDNEINGMLASQLIQAFGLDPIVADSGEKAIEKAEDGPYAFILMDHIMPGMDGIEASTLLSTRYDYPIYAMTGDLTVQVAAAFKSAGARGAISKPIKPEELLGIIRECVPEGGYVVPVEMKAADKNISVENGETQEIAVLKSCMSTVNGLDVAEGLSNALGNTANYLRLLKVSSSNIRQYVNILRDYLETGNPQKLQIASHSLKSVFSNIGLEILRTESEQVERLAGNLLEKVENEGGIASVPSEYRCSMDDYISHTMNAALELEAALEAYESARTDLVGEEDYDTIEAPLSPEDITEVFEYTQTALNRFEIDYVLEGLEYLKAASMGDDKRKIEEAIDAANTFEYERVEELLTEVISLKKGRGEAR